MLPASSDLVVCFAHVAYRLKDAFDASGHGVASFELRSKADLLARAAEADVIVASGLWDNAILDAAPRLRFVQSTSAGVNQFDAERFAERGVRLASGQGVNARAVSHHVMASILALARRLPDARDNQARKLWRPMQGDPALREDELTDKTLLVVGLGGIGSRVARLAKAFEMRVVGVRRDPARGPEGADSVHALSELPSLLPQADVVALTCPLTPETRGLIDASALGLMRPTAFLVNAARGACVVEADLVEALAAGRIEGAALDTVDEEPLSVASPLWEMPNVLLTPHSAGETRRYEQNVVALLNENLARLRRGESELRNGVV